MKNQISIYLIFLSTLSLFSCVKEINDNNSNHNNTNKIELTSDEITSICYDEPKTLSEQEVFSIISEFQETLQSQGANTKSSSTSQYKIKNKYFLPIKSSIQTRSGETVNQQIPIFEVIAESNGQKDFIVISADERVPKILYYGFDIKSEDLPIEIRYIIELAKNSIKQDICRIDSLQECLRSSTISKLSQKINMDEKKFSFEDIKEHIISIDNMKTKGNPIGGYDKPTQIMSFVNPMTKTEWDQTEPYNNEMPIVDIFDVAAEDGTEYSVKGHAPLGCATVCIAQLLACVKAPFTGVTLDGKSVPIDWKCVTQSEYIFMNEDFPGNPDYNSPADQILMITGLMRQVFLGLKSTFVLSPQGFVKETSTTDANMLSYLSTVVNYQGGESRMFDASYAKNSLTNLKPVLLYGQGTVSDDFGNVRTAGHAWLLDGYFLCRKAGQTSPTQQDFYWSVNIGWGYCNSKGYFLASGQYLSDCDVVMPNGWTGTCTFLTQDQHMLYNITKK